MIMFWGKYNFSKLIVLILFFGIRIYGSTENSIDKSFYKKLTTIVDRYTRPITVLGVMNSYEDYAFEIARNYNATCVVVEEDVNKKDRMISKCLHEEKLDNVMLLSKKMSVEDLERLASCEHFDVVLIFNLNYQWQQECERTIKAVLNLGDNIILEVPPCSSCGRKLKNYLLDQKSDIIWKDFSSSGNQEKIVFWFKNHKESLDRHHWFGKSGFSSDYIITSNFHEKNIYKTKENKKNKWIPGINLLTFVMLDGAWPKKSFIRKSIEQLRDIDHEDFMMWNMIIQGFNIIPIDYTIASRNPLDKVLCVSFTLEMLEQHSSEQAIQWFKDNWAQFAKKQGREIPLSFFDV